MLADPLQDIDQVVIRIDVVEAASGQQTLHDADVFSPKFCPAKHPRCLTQGARWFVITPCQYCAVNLFSATAWRCGRRVFRHVQIIEDETDAEAESPP